MDQITQTPKTLMELKILMCAKDSAEISYEKNRCSELEIRRGIHVFWRISGKVGNKI